MMNGRFLKSSTVDELRKNIKDNLHIYRSGNFDYLAMDSSHWFEAKWQMDEALLLTLKPEDTFEKHNAITVFKALNSLLPYDARDERLWVYLTHTLLLDFSRKRWPIPDDDEKAISHIKNHFFAKEKRDVERDNAVSRSWWIAYLCSRVETLPIDDALEAFLYRQETWTAIVGRPSTSQSVSFFGALLSKLSESYKGAKSLYVRETFRTMLVEINSIGGFKLLDYLDATQAEDVLDGIIKHRLQISSI
jgi:hypothetical protein